ncbi:hypothetical protein HY065_02205, partial [Candidatus Berkelbacteria bacterium]|nr:hypothetical protein [Candidatus Berkelbacteria bacterium]
MDAQQFLMAKLEELCLKLFPGSLVEVKDFGGVGIWPYLDADGNEVPNEDIAAKLKEYRES